MVIDDARHDDDPRECSFVQRNDRDVQNLSIAERIQTEMVNEEMEYESKRMNEDEDLRGVETK